MKKIKCEKCEKLITANNYKRHSISCENKKQIYKIDEKWKIDDDKYKCPFCDEIYNKKGISTHIWRKHTENGKSHHPSNGFKENNRVIWNKGLNKNNNEDVKKQSETVKNKIKNGEIIPYWKNRKHSEETKRKIGQKLTKNNNGGKCKWFNIVKNDGTEFKLQGTWEVRFSTVLNIIDKDWIKIGVGHKYHSFIWKDDNNIEHYYTPDFYSPKLNKYFEVKGYWWGNDKLKMKKVIEQNKNINIEIVMKSDLLKYEKLIN